jgi:succinate-acetate transporter protein
MLVLFFLFLFLALVFAKLHTAKSSHYCNVTDITGNVIVILILISAKLHLLN